MQCINHAAKPVQCSTLYFGAGRHSQGAGGRGQETAPGRLVPAGLYPWQGGERRPAMGNKRHGPGSSLTMPLAGRTKCGLPDLPGLFHKNKQKVSDPEDLPKVSGKETFNLKWDLHRLLSQMSFF